MLTFKNIDFPNYKNSLNYKDSIFLIGSCFAENINASLIRDHFKTLANPFGICFNPKSIATILNRVLDKNYYNESDFFFHDNYYWCFEHHGVHAQINLNENIISALQKKGYTHPTPIQLQAIPHILEGKDFLGIAQTGTGKTGAFALPIIHNLSENHQKNSPNQISALILTPTRELATQIADNIKVYGKNSHLTCATVFGGVSEVHQIKSLRSGVDILIATPGRLLDLTKQKYVDYSKLKILVP